MSPCETSRSPVNPKTLRRRILPALRELYHDRAEECADKILSRAGARFGAAFDGKGSPYDEGTVILITYADQVRAEGCAPLEALRRFLEDYHLSDCFSTLHILPFFPYSSDDGFSVVDYRKVDPEFGTWEDVERLSKRFALMFDLVLNHVSRRSDWFAGFRRDDPRYRKYFIVPDVDTDLSAVTRPRNSPLLTPVRTARGTRHVWTTFSDDQIDLNYAEPDVLVEMMDVLFFYVDRGASIIRLDAIAYLWKEPGTRCIHLPQTHLIVKLIRILLDALAPGTVLLTETNVPHAENVAYLGDGDEAGMVYQFSLAPLLLEAILSDDATYLNEWLRSLAPPPARTTVLNFTASHDGLGVRPLEGILPKRRFDRFAAEIRRRGGLVSTKRDAGGGESPYELNVTYYSAMAEPDAPRESIQMRRFLASQKIMAGLQGIPGVYFHGLTGTPNDAGAVERTGRARSINRRKFERTELDEIFRDDSARARVFEGVRHLLRIRRRQPAFHPWGSQEFVSFSDPAIVGFIRTSLDAKQRILVLANLSRQPRNVDIGKGARLEPTIDILSSEGADSPCIPLDAYQVRWLLLR